MPFTRDQPPDPPATAAEPDEVVTLFARAGAREQLERHAAELEHRYRPLVDLQRAAPAAYEALIGAPGLCAASPARWSDRGRADGAAAVESEVLMAALRGRRALPDRARLLVEVTASALIAASTQRALAAVGPLSSTVFVVVADEPGSDPLSLDAALEGVRRAGARIAVEERRGGHEALRRLALLRPDHICAGRELVAAPEREPADAAAIAGLVALGRRIGATVMAQDVGTPAQLKALAGLGVRFASGPLLGAPASTPTPLAREAAAVVAAAAPRAAGLTVAALIEPLPALPAAATLDQVAEAFLEDPANDWIVLVEDGGRPAALAERAGFLRAEPFERAVMWVTPTSPARAVAQKAIARPPLERFAPLVCCDEHERYVGAVRIERLVEALAS